MNALGAAPADLGAVEAIVRAACLDALGVADDDPRVNAQGGAIALGHPWGASGALLVVRLFARLVRAPVPAGSLGLATCAVGGGQGLALLAERVAGATAFWSAEGVELKTQRDGFREFRVDDYGAPSYPELVLCVTRRTLDEQKPMIRATIRALQRGYGETQRDPESAVSAMLAAEPDLDGQQIMEILDVPPGPVVGEAYRFLLEHRMDEGPQSYDAARDALLAWWAARP